MRKIFASRPGLIVLAVLALGLVSYWVVMYLRPLVWEGTAFEHASNSIEICVPMPTAEEGHVVVLGDLILENTKSKPVTLESIELVNAGGLELVAAYVNFMQYERDGSFSIAGVSTGWPPKFVADNEFGFRTFQQLEGFKIPAKKSPENDKYNLILHLRVTGDSAQMDPVRIHYKLNGLPYRQTAPSALEVKKKC